ncbi:AAA family ATPase [Flectobacillus roseus]
MEYIKIQNFKCFEEIDIPLNKLTVLAGANGNGKSTVVQAILFLRKTIEENASTIQSGFANTEYPSVNKISLNTGYMLALGNSSLVLNQQSATNEISLSLFTEEEEITIDYDADEISAQLYLTIKQISAHTVRQLSIASKEFYYLNAERIGPRVSQPISYFEFPHAGYQGEYVAQLIATTNYQIQIEESRRHPSTKSPRLEQQVNAWLDELMPGVAINAIQSLETLTAQVKIQNHFTKNGPTLSTNIGFGISYVLPIIATGLVAESGSYFIIENPEAHLHPSAQSKIGRFISMVAQSGVNVIIETHSDHVINGIQIAAAKKEIDNNAVTINFFSQTEDSPQPAIENISINGKGELSKWPKGFFDQTQVDFAELFNLRKQ